MRSEDSPRSASQERSAARLSRHTASRTARPNFSTLKERATHYARETDGTPALLASLHSSTPLHFPVPDSSSSSDTRSAAAMRASEPRAFVAAALLVLLAFIVAANAARHGARGAGNGAGRYGSSISSRPARPTANTLSSGGAMHRKIGANGRNLAAAGAVLECPDALAAAKVRRPSFMCTCSRRLAHSTTSDGGASPQSSPPDTGSCSQSAVFGRRQQQPYREQRPLLAGRVRERNGQRPVGRNIGVDPRTCVLLRDAWR